MPSSDPRPPDLDYEVSDPIALPKAPVVSVLMLAYNHSSYLAQAIDGVLAQQAKFPIELLIGEDCSTDDTREIALRYQRQYPHLIRVITADANVGVQRNWQRLMLAARGEFFAHLDGDDYWLPGKLARQIPFLQQHTDCVAVYTNAVTIDETGHRIGLFNDVRDARFDLAAMLRRGNFLNTSSMVFRASLRHVLLELESIFIDYKVHLRLARFGFLAQLPEPLTAYRENSIGSMTSKSNDLVRSLYWDAIMDVPRELVTDDDLAHGVADFFKRVISRSLREKRWDLVREWAPQVFNASPYGAVTTALLVLGSAVRTTRLEILGKLRTGPDGLHINIRHRR